MILRSSDITELLNILRKYFAICRKFTLKLHAKKYDLYLKEVKWCDRVID